MIQPTDEAPGNFDPPIRELGDNRPSPGLWMLAEVLSQFFALVDVTVITSLANSTASDAKTSNTEWKRVPGGFAVKVTLEDGMVVALMRGGPRLKTPPEKIEGFGHSTAKEFAWFHVKSGKLIHTGSREADATNR